jgi:hypothetical protein
MPNLRGIAESDAARGSAFRRARFLSHDGSTVMLCNTDTLFLRIPIDVRTTGPMRKPPS